MNLLITGAWSGAKECLPELTEDGHNALFMQNESDPLPCVPEWVEGVICNGLFLYHCIEQFVNLRYIQLTSAGFDHVSMAYVKSHHIEIHNARGVYGIPMAEFALCGVLQIYKQSRFFAENQRNMSWKKHRGLLELYGKTVCIVGCGNIGSECAKRFSAFGCVIVGVDLYPRKDSQYQEIHHISKLDDVLTTSDVIVFTLPLTDETRYMMNRDRFMLLKETAVIVNISRGAIFDTLALIEVMPHLGGAVLDVFDEEPLPRENALWRMNNVIISPHNSFVGDGNDLRLCKVIIDNLKVLSG